ncbi:MAG TPA: argininosuccinate lyase [Candidatus Kapabacteria bacterium]|nr:argininosuccinate lyase [Candidatus Kapabacteria bacterium]
MTQPRADILWGGRFSEQPSPLAARFSNSLETDFTFFREDITGSIAHATMLGTCGIISENDANAIVKGLKLILLELEENGIPQDIECEDIHSLVETMLVRKIGDVGKKLHTARSRNDQVALDERLYLRVKIDALIDLLRTCSRAFIEKAEASLDMIMPGYTHLQHAQPVMLSHHLLAYVAMFDRDSSRFSDALWRSDLSPLGAAAFAGTSFPIDREQIANELGFRGITINSVDSVSDRDHLIETISACAITMMHLSRFAEESVLWSSSEFSFVRFSDRLTTGSSIMPQKKNPDMAELIRGKTGKVYGALMNLLTTMKALPLAYNRDMQEDKQPLFDALDTTADCVQMTTELIEDATFNKEKMTVQLSSGFLTATELADYLVTKAVAFRDAHSITGKLVAYAEEHNCQLHELPISVLKTYSPQIGDDIYDVLDPVRAVHRKRSAGGTAISEVLKQIEQWKQYLNKK